ncbi:MAG TPA: SDR family oxidoreductase [Cyclobacteriaceae bacterium]|nr:SDR family oxidoreductase [Cytophagales bacterium]HNT49307.1 SDR family oxidoreductase [Cyclobacteriaceae bacterium]HRE67129.1 SDR family oxidoreductase [Cyclobacteriaceae bacterium]HRF34764.1 SDR family oxidoreductase [Cyclobacteriaceae bacterium]
MNLNLEGKNALVCGSTQGIGKASAVELAKMGATITLVARNEQILQATCRELSVHASQKHTYLVADFSLPDQLKTVIESFVMGKQIHVLINNTGGPPAGLAIDALPGQFIEAFNTHLICNHILTQAVAAGMKQAGYGRIINIISTSVKIPLRGLGVSNTIRGAVANWSKTLSVELAPFGITVNNVLPGTTMTGRLDSLIKSKAERSGKTYDQVKQEMINEVPAGRISEPHEVAAAVAFLASPAAGYINGINLPVDGGRTGSL